MNCPKRNMKRDYFTTAGLCFGFYNYANKQIFVGTGNVQSLTLSLSPFTFYHQYEYSPYCFLYIC